MVPNKPYKGFFLTIEGGEGSGKSYLAEKLTLELRALGYQVVKTREPGGSLLSEELRKLILEPPSGVKIGDRAELLLFLASRAEHVEEVILPALHEGKIVLCERFNDSTIAYQGCARHLGMGYVDKLCHLATTLDPDLTLLLDLDPELGLERVEKKRQSAFDRLEREHLQFHRDVRQGFLHLADQYPSRITIVDANNPPEIVLATALQAVGSALV
jgi:dTMP kinase